MRTFFATAVKFLVLMAITCAFAGDRATAQTSEITISGSTKGCYLSPCPSAFFAPNAVFFDLNFNGSSFSGTTVNGLLPIGNAPNPGSNVNNLGSFTLHTFPESYDNVTFTLAVTFTAPAGIDSGNNPARFTAVLHGNVTSTSGGIFIDFDNTPQLFTFSGTNGSGAFTLTVNDLSVTKGGSAPITGTIRMTEPTGSQQASVSVASSQNPSVAGDAVTFTATVSAATGTPTGTVQFKVDGAALGSPVTLSNGVASISTSSLTNGAHTITAEYSGDANFAPSTGTLAGGQVVSTSCQAQTDALQQQINQLTQQNEQLQNQVASLIEQNRALTQQNTDLQNQLTAANQTISDLRAQIAQLQAQNAQAQSAVTNFLNIIQADLRVTFKNPRFTIPGATPLQQLQNLQRAIVDLNKGRKEGLYQSLGGKP